MEDQKKGQSFPKTYWPKSLKRYVLIMLIGLFAACLSGVLVPAAAIQPRPIGLAQTTVQSPAALSARGQRWFESGDYQAAARAWRQAADGFAANGESLEQVRNLNNLVQAYQHLGQWSEATSALEQSLVLLEQGTDITPTEQPALWGQTRTVQGGLALAQSNPQAALEAFEQGEAYYRAAGQNNGILRSQVNQARALRTAGLYRQGIELLDTIDPPLSRQGFSTEVAAGLRTLGELYRTVGELDHSEASLTAGLTLAEQLGDEGAIASTRFSLATTHAAAGDLTIALEQYQAVAATSLRPELAVRATVAQLPLLAQLGQAQQLDTLVQELTPQLGALPPGSLRACGLIDAANTLVDLQGSPYQSIALAWLTEALDNARAVSSLRAESYALGTLGKLYGEAGELPDAKALTQQALTLALQANAPEISYLWNAQLGNFQRKTEETEAAIANYTAAVNTLETLRRDLVAIDDDVRYNFRETVEPVYRNLVDLLTARADVDQPKLEQARAVIEALQLAELENFFREACLPVSENIDQVVDSTARSTAVLYPIILPDRLEVVVKLPRQPLTHFSTPVTKTELDSKLQEFRRDVVRPYTLKKVQAEAGELYRWLVEPVVPQLAEANINTLVFVLDGALRNIPMGLLHNGDRYLIQDFGVAIAPGLQLVDPQSLTGQNLSVIIAGISEERSSFPALPNVTTEVQEVEAALPSQVLLNEAFTVSSLGAEINANPFPVVHLATHGEFSSNPADTFILAWDDRIPLAKLNSILRNSEQSRQSAIELLVLSACETATGDSRAALGLAGVAVRAGARSTVASLWNLDDETTALIMNQFYQALKTPGISRAEALRQAQLAIINNPRYEHPRHWAPYVLIGNWL